MRLERPLDEHASDPRPSFALGCLDLTESSHIRHRLASSLVDPLNVGDVVPKVLWASEQHLLLGLYFATGTQPRRQQKSPEKRRRRGKEEHEPRKP